MRSLTLDFLREHLSELKVALASLPARTICSYILLSLALAAFSVGPLHAQQFAWARQIGGASIDNGEKVALDTDENVYVTGNVQPSASFVSKFDSVGNVLWTRQFGGSFEGVYDMAVDGDDNAYVAGYFTGSMDFDSGPGNFTLTAPAVGNFGFIAKFNAAGGLVWARHVGPGSVHGVAVDNDGNAFATGDFSGSADFDPGQGVATLTSVGVAGDIFVLKLDASGDYVWARQMGGEGSEVGRSIAVDIGGNLVITGDFVSGTVDFDPGPGAFPLTPVGPPGNPDIFVAKLDGAGGFLWAHQMGGPNVDRGWSVATDSAGNILTTGRFFGVADFDPGNAVYNLTSAGDEDIFVSKLDGSGNFIWARGMGGTGRDYSYDVAVDASGSVFTAGVFQSTVDFDPGSGIYNLSSVLGVDGFISKLDSAGNFVWAQQMTGASGYSSAGVAVAGGGVYATGRFSLVGDFNPDGGGFQLTSNGQADAFIAKYADVTANILRPQISEGGIVLATLLPKVETISGLSIISVFGEHFTDETILYPNLNENGRIDYQLGGVCLTMNGEPLPIFAVTPGQINAQVSNLHGMGPATFVAVSSCGTSAALSSAPAKLAASSGRRELASDGTLATVEEATPAFFVFDPVTSDGYIAARFNATEAQAPVPVAPTALYPNDSYGPSRPAVPGDIILLFGTGWGPTQTSGSTGYPVSEAGEVLPEANPTVMFGGAMLADEDVLYVGVTPGYAGLYQLAIRVPQTAQPGNHRVVLTVYGKSTPTGPVLPVAAP